MFLRYASLLIHPGEGDIDDDITEDKSGDIEFDTDDASNNFSSEFRRFSWFEIFDFLITNLELLVWICPRKSFRLSDIDSVVIFNDLLSDLFSLKIFNFNLYIKSELFYEGKWVLNDSVQNILSGDTNVHLAQCQSVNQSIINYLRLILITSNSKLSLYIPVNLSWIYYFMKVLVCSTDGGPTELSHVLNGHHWDRSDEFFFSFYLWVILGLLLKLGPFQEISPWVSKGVLLITRPVCVKAQNKARGPVDSWRTIEDRKSIEKTDSSKNTDREIYSIWIDHPSWISTNWSSLYKTR